MRFRIVIELLMIATIPILIGCNSSADESAAATPDLTLALPAGLPPIPVPSDNRLTDAKIELGRQLFFDKRLSVDDSISCASCHDPEHGWSNGERYAIGVNGEQTRRHVPTLYNSAYYKFFFWDGRAFSLEHQALMPVLNAGEMGMESDDALVAKLETIPEYQRQFAECYEDGLTAKNVGYALASFERTILYGDTAFAEYEQGNRSAMSPSAVRGMKLFFNERKTNCSACHEKPLFTDKLFYNIGVGMDQPDPDLGYFLSTGFTGSKGAFKTPSLLGVAESAPYMHDGSIATLEEVVEYYDKGGIPNPKLDGGVRRLRLTEGEKKDLVQFMKEGLSRYQPKATDDHRAQ